MLTFEKLLKFIRLTSSGNVVVGFLLFPLLLMSNVFTVVSGFINGNLHAR